MIDNFMPRVSPPPSTAFFSENCTFQGIIVDNTGLPSGGNNYGDMWYATEEQTIYIYNGDTVAPWSAFLCLNPPTLALVSLYTVLNLGGTTIYTDTPLDNLKNYLTVLGVYNDNTVDEIDAADYTLSGTLTVGTSTVTVAINNITTTFEVEVEQAQ